MQLQSITLEQILCSARTPDGGKVKKRLSGSVWVTPHGIEADSGEKEHYADADCALMQYALEHYDFWRRYYPAQQALLATPGIFGENLSTRGIDEQQVCPGDIYQLGGAMIQVSWGREACGTMAARLSDAQAPEIMHQQSRNGWFYRVLQEGEIRQGMPLTLVERRYADWPLSRVQSILFNASACYDQLEAIEQIASLSEAWRQKIRARLAAFQVSGEG